MRARDSRAATPVTDAITGPQSADYEESKSVELRDGELWVGDNRLSSLRMESWPRETLHRLIKDVQSLQLKSMRGFVESHPTGHLFVSNEDYTESRMWHEDTVFHAMKGVVVNQEGEEVEVFGRIAVPRDLHPDAYALRAAVVRAYRAPEYVRYLVKEGSDYEAKVLAEHPDAIADVTSDLTHWKYFSPDGRLVGSMSRPRNGNN